MYLRVSDLPLDLLQQLICLVGYVNAMITLSSCRALSNLSRFRIEMEGKKVYDFKLWDKFSSSRYDIRGIHPVLSCHVTLCDKVRQSWVQRLTIEQPTTLDLLVEHETLTDLKLYDFNDASKLKRCLQHLPKLKTLHLVDCKELVVAAHCGMLTQLIVYACNKLPSLENFPALELQKQIRIFHEFEKNSFVVANPQ